MKLKSILSECWTGYKQVGLKNKGGKQVPNCVPESVNESWEIKDGKVLSNGKLIGYYSFDRDSDSFWVDDVKKGKGQLSFDTKKEVEDYFKKNEKDAVKHLGKLRESTNPSDIIKDLDKVRTDLIKKVDVLIAKKKKLYSDVDITTPMSADEKQLDKDIQSIFSQIQQIIQQKRKIKNESVNEGKYYVGYNKGRGQGTGVFKDSYSTYNDAKKEVEKLEKQRGGSYNMIAYYVADKDGKFVRESVNEARNLKSIEKEFFGVSTEIQNTLVDYKKHKGTDKEKGIVSKLKQLSDKKKKLEKEMDLAISGLYRDAELKVED